MIDYAKITVSAGNGGDGAGSFHHIKGKRRGKADGGDGGRGGDVYFVVSGDLNTLEPFRYVKEYQASTGGRGASNRRKGADGASLEIKVPRGTQVRTDRKTQRIGISENSEDQKIRKSDKSEYLTGRSSEYSEFSEVYDLAEIDQRILIARGGEGGRGNAHLRDEYGRRPLAGEKGQKGEVLELELELKLIADVGLVGLPNAGKSTLLRALTSATPKVADYPFTTLEPNLGVMDGSRFIVHGSWLDKKRKHEASINNELLTINKPAKLVIADIPGLIEGASEGKGLGDLFLRHIDRTKLIVHVIDTGSEDVWKSYQVIRNELKKYPSDIFKKREIVVLNKIDLIDDELKNELVSIFKKKKKKVVAISAQTGEGVDGLVKEIAQGRTPLS